MRISRRGKFEREMSDELAFHLEAYTEELIRSGVDPAEAKRRARLEFGSIESAKEECRQAWGLRWMDELRADVRLALRTFRRSPAFAAVAIVSLALGIGANTAIFGLAEAVLLRTRAVRDPGRLVFVHTAGLSGRDGPPYPYFELLRTRTSSFESTAAFSPSNMELAIERGREQARGVWVSGNFYETLGVSPVMGRTLTAADDQTPGKGGPDGAVAVISRAYWQERFGGDPDIVGRTIRMNFGFVQPVTIVGVMPTELMSLEPGRPTDIAVPMALSDPAKMRDRTSLWLFAVGRLRPGVSVERAGAECNALFQTYMADVRLPEETRRRLFDHVELAPAGKGLGSLRMQFAQPLTVLMILAVAVLLAACVNVANLMLARATARQKEFAVRLAIGAGRARLIRQTLTEALLLVGLGAALGVFLARQGQLALANLLVTGRNQILLDLPLNGRMLLFTLAIALLSGLALGILPALRASRVDPGNGLESGSKGVAGSRVSLRLGRALVITQVALSMVLLAGALLFVRTLQRLGSVDLGFAREGILTMEVTPERGAYGAPQWFTDQADVLERVRRIPGVSAASWATMSPLSGRDRGAVLDVQGFQPRSEQDKEVHLAALSPDYFETYGIPMLLGRAFRAADTAASARAAIVNETAARFYFGKSVPIGKRVRFANYPDANLIYEIVGVVKDTKHDSLREQPQRFIYVPIPQSLDRINRLTLSVRCVGDAAAWAPLVRSEVLNVRPTALVNNVSTVELQVRQSLRNERLVAALAVAFGGLALALACIGLYGVLTYAVTRRTSEIGIRMALGATQREVVWLILREAIALATAGILIGTPAIVVLARVSRALLYGVREFDIPTFALSLLALFACAAIAGGAPARRASRLDPMSALRCE